MEPLRCLVVAVIAALGVIAGPGAVALGPRPALAASAEAEAAAEAEMLKARQLMERGEDAAAIDHLLAARALAPEASGPYLHLGLAYARLGRCEDAIPMLEEYLQRKRSSPHVSAAATLAACRKAGAASAPARKPDEVPLTTRAPEIPATSAAPPAAAMSPARALATAPGIALAAPPPFWIATPAQVQSPPASPSRAALPAEKSRPAWPVILGVTAGLIVVTCVVTGLAVGLTNPDPMPGGGDPGPSETLFPTGTTP